MIKKLSELKISPSPWGIYQTKKEVAVTTSAEGFGDLDSALCRGPRRKSNARLIAAAPKLYECLHEAVVDMCNYCADFKNGVCDSAPKTCYVQKWRAALAEAAGEEVAE